MYVVGNSAKKGRQGSSEKTRLTAKLNQRERDWAGILIKQQDCTTPHKTLGEMETQSGDYKIEVKRLVEKARAVVFGPIESGGLGLRHLFSGQV